jgi:hypothetical protein
MTKILQYIFSFTFIFLGGIMYGQQIKVNENLNWQGIQKETYGNIHFEYLYFEGADINPENSLPQFVSSFPVSSGYADIDIQLANEVYSTFLPYEDLHLQQSNYLAEEIAFHTEIYFDKGNPVGVVKFIPIRYNQATQLYEKLVSFSLHINYSVQSNAPGSGTKEYAENSVLSEGDWYKISVQESGIYKISYTQLEAMGINPAGINPKNIRLYGNGGSMLPEKNIHERYDDLYENAITVVGEEDGVFDTGDYILFYGMSPHTWEIDGNVFEYQMNLYEDYTFYYLTTSMGEGKRIESEFTSSNTPNYFSNRYNNLQVFEEDLVNLISSGKAWYGESIETAESRSYNFYIADIMEEESTIVRVGVANRNFEIEDLVIKVGDDFIDSVNLVAVNNNTHKYAQAKTVTNIVTGLTENINVELQYIPQLETSRMWVDYILINAISELNFHNGQLSFRDLESIGIGSVSEFTLGNSNEQVKIWDVSDPLVPKNIETSYNNGSTSMIVSTSGLREFVAFDGTHYKTAEFVEKMENQNLHGYGPIDLLIITPPEFKEQAKRLETLHDSLDNMRVLLVEPMKIYNEFSSGKQDPTAIRDFIRMLYSKYEGDSIRFVLLFGDGSFDPKDRVENNTNFIPTFQTKESLLETSSYVVDDYYGLLDENEGNDSWGMIDIGIGRMPVQTVEQAKTAVDKIYKYVSQDPAQFGKWRTKVCLIADDEDGNLHMEQADSLKYYVPDEYTTHKIYFDAFEQIDTPTGEKFPEATDAINKQVNDGALIINYVGHGGVTGWSHERVITLSDINSWTNKDRLPVFITATCEFSRFDEPDIVTGGEDIFRNPNGGGIALLTTTRVAYSQSNFKLNLRLNSRTFLPMGDEMPYLGDLIRESKPPGQTSTRNFVLLGDPALKMAYPKYHVSTTTFMGKDASDMIPDTVRSLQKVTVTGEITDRNGNRKTDFNGIILPELYDSPMMQTTLGTDGNSYPTEFETQTQVLWHGQFEVKEGQFSFELVIPKDISFKYGKGKLSYYAYSDKEDAFGCYTDFTIGGIDENASIDEKGPDINLFINNYKFVSGDLTHQDPLLIAHISDENGINLSTNGIGHEMTLVLNNDFTNVIQITNLFVPDTNSYQSGVLHYPFYNLPNGKHTLVLKAWDSYNNSNEASIEFVINGLANLSLSQVKNVPNPFKDNTRFEFKHTKPGQELDITLEIYNITGKFVLSYRTQIMSEDIFTSFLEWDGRDVNGKKVPAGLYVYVLKVTDEEGTVSTRKQKMVIGR